MPSGQLTLLDTAKTLPEGPVRGVIETYASAYHPMTVMPMPEAMGGQWKWDLENELPYTTGGTRAINGSYSATKSQISPFFENVRIYGGQVKVDQALVKINPGKVAQERMSQIKAKARRFTIDMFEGASGNALRGIADWLDNEEVFANQTINIGAASAGGTLLTDHLDELLSLMATTQNTYIYCSRQAHLRIKKLSRGTNATNDISFQNRFSPEQWGYFGGQYNGVPVIPLIDGKGNDLLSTTDGDGSSTRIYCVSYGPELFTGFQTGTMEVKPKGDSSVFNYFEMEHLVGTAPQAYRCIASLRYVDNDQ